MRIARALLAVVGMAVFAGGLATIVAPNTAGVVPVGAVVERLGNDYILVALLGAAGVATTVAVVGRQSVRGIDQATPPDPEGPPTGRRPGSRFDDTVDAWRGMALWIRPSRRRRVRERLSDAAVGVVTRTEGCSRDEARRQVERGTWTDDQEAAAFLATDGGIAPLAAVIAVLRGRAPVKRRVHRTVLAIERIELGDQE